MPTAYGVRIHGIVEAGKRAAVTAAINAVLDRADLDHIDFTVPLNATGTGLPTHYGMSSVFRLNDNVKISSVSGIPASSGLRVWRGFAVGTDDQASVFMVDVGTVVPNGTDTQTLRYTWARCLAEANLKTIEPPGV